MQIETLEGRQLFSVASPVLAGNELQVFGDSSANVIKVSKSDAQTVRVEIDGQVFQFASNAIRAFRLNVSPTDLTHGTAGNDRVQIVSTAALPVTQSARIFGGEGDDILIGGDGFDTLFGEAGNDSLTGGKNSDTLDGGEGNNSLNGGEGDDVMTAGEGDDAFDGGSGTDLVSYASRDTSTKVSLDNVANDGRVVVSFGRQFQVEHDNVKESVENVSTGSGNDVIIAGRSVVNNVFRGGAGNDRVEGKAGDDLVFAGAGNDVVLGGEGNDGILGGEGNDILSGNKGNDTLQGEAGDDIITGGVGRDSILAGAGNDFIFAQDGVIDAELNGGDGFDTLESDDNDPAAELVEQLL